jgi:glycosyltransferase involved in cell wall biosynthesis
MKTVIQTSKGVLNVAVVTRSLEMGGAQHHIVKLCQQVSRQDVRISLFMLCRDEEMDLAPSLPKDVPVYVSPYRRHHPLVLKWLANKFQEHEIDVVHSFLWTADVFCGLVRLLFSNVPLICSERGDRGISENYQGWRNWIDRIITFRAADRFCSNSRFGKTVLIESGCNTTEIDVIPNGIDIEKVDLIDGIDLRKKLGWPEGDGIILGIACRLIWYKGVDVLVRALSKLIAQNISVYGVIIGDGPEKLQLEKLVQELGIQNNVAFVGQVFPVESFVKGLDIATLMTLTDSESCSNSILEYMACGKPVIASNGGGSPELVVQNETGLLITRGDVDVLADAICQLALSPNLMESMGLMSRKRIEERFQINTTTQRFVSLWHQVARESP